MSDIIAKQMGWMDMQKKHLQSRGGKQMEVVCANSVYRQCGKPLEEKSAARKQIYCSDECRRLWVKKPSVSLQT